MNEFEQVQEATNKIIDVLNHSKLSGMTIFYMLGDIQNMVRDQIVNQGGNSDDTEVHP